MFISSLLITCVFYLFPLLWCTSQDLQYNLNRSDYSGYPCLIPNARGEAFSISLLGMVFAVDVVCVLILSVMSDSLQPHRLQTTRLLCPWSFPGKDTGAGCHFLLQGIFLTQGWNPCLLCLLYWPAYSSPLCHLVRFFVGNIYQIIFI